MDDKFDFKVVNSAPAVAEYLNLREQAGMSPRSEEGAALGLRNSLFAVSLYQDSELVGMGRVVGDGGCFMQVVDIAVRPDFQGRGLGTAIMREIMRYLEEETPANAYVSLIADVPADKLYAKFGFEYTEPRSRGMFLRMP
ncbi:GNAT family N-acetyltransferase [Paenibacillus sp. M1]|uniref:GNAT family N-acetyltransferase n=1 Tax=Paenibacillus haidiansis TaxID=1574488 RepID=A0ABU7VRA3_9BACL